MNSRDDFEGWLLFMDDTIGQFLSALPPGVAGRLDYSLASLSVLERWLLENYRSPQDILRDSENFTLDRASRYVGETIRHILPTAVWDIEFEKSDAAYYALPIMRNGGKWVDCPASLVTASLDRRTGSFIEGVARALVME